MPFIGNLDPLVPQGSESLSLGDDRIRNIVQTLMDQFNNGTGWAEAITLTVAQINAMPADILARIQPTDYATSTVGGTIKMRVDGTDLYIRNDGTDA